MTARRGVRFRLLTLTLPALIVTALLAIVLIEVWVRARWDEQRGSPGLFVSDPVRGQRLAANYDGWFAGVPTRINNLGFRDADDASLEKAPHTFRILVLGDSVTFGHGSVHTYPELLEQQLRAWRPEIDWQVWNLGVPGYNTSQELAQLLELGPSYQPDLVVVGFFENDITDNQPLAPPSLVRRTSSEVLSWVQRHVYSFELYKRLGLQLAWRLSDQDAYRLRLLHLETESALLAATGKVSAAAEQRLSDYERLSPAAIAGFDCVDGEQPDPDLVAAVQRQPGFPHWLAAVRSFQQLHREGRYRIVFFVQATPPICAHLDRFYEGGNRLWNDFLMQTMGDGVPAVSTFDGFLARRPSQMPAARAHAIGNANLTKAEVLFDFLREHLTSFH